jgi:hypothetical protein
LEEIMFKRTALQHTLCATILAFAGTLAIAQENRIGGSQPALTIYNANFAVVRQRLALDLTAGVNHVTFAEATAHIEPDSVILRDPSGHRVLQVLEQNYRNDPLSQGLLLSLYEGKTLDFEISGRDPQGNLRTEVVRGKIIRSGYNPHSQPGGYTEPVIEVNGRLQFTLPGQPIFPSLGENTILKPTLDWLLETDKPGASEAELSYVTGGMSWHADYNIVAPVQGDTIDLVGWITISNDTGKDFEQARIKLIAGDVHKLQDQGNRNRLYDMAMKEAAASPAPPVTEKSFDEYHLYSLERATTLRDRQTKQVEFVAATGIKSQRIYVYNGAAIDASRYGYYNFEQVRNDPGYGTQSNPKVWVMQQFKNSAANHLGMPLPQGRLRFYRRDDDGQMEFTGENTIDHTPSDETVRVYTGNAFDVVGERLRTNYKVNTREQWMDESFQIKLRNHKKQAVTVRVVERLYRWSNWEIVQNSQDYRKRDAQTIEFSVEVPADGEQVVTYGVHYSW